MEPGTPKATTRPVSIGFKSPSTNATSPTRSGGLSWQKRPTSNDTDEKPVRTTSSHATDVDVTSTESPTIPESTTDEDAEPSRNRIAQSLGSKDPAWFRQTADRGVGSPAYRKNQDDTMSDVSSIGGSMKLPGMGRESTTEQEKTPSTHDHGSERSRSPSRASSTYGSSSFGNRYSSVSSVSTSSGPASISTSQRLDSRNIEPLTPTAGDTQAADRFAMSPSQGRLSPERSTSPTKGLGGFVQSAMMKRSDSASKRWSSQAGPGLSRGNSIASNRSGFGQLNSANTSWDMKTAAPLREGSPLASSRPGSSHSEATVIHNIKEQEQPSDLSSNDGFVKPPLRPQNTSVDYTRNRDRNYSEVDVPTSPSKTMDPKRWSPTKASWLESALNRPESPKPKLQAPQQPGWMKDINKTRQQRASVDLGKSPNFKEVTTPGLIRSPPLGTGFKKPESISEKPGAFSSISSKITESENGAPSTGSIPESSPEITQDPPVLKPAFSASSEPDAVATKSPSPEGSLRTASPKPSLDAISSKPKPQPPPSGVKDFRSNLRPRGMSGQNNSKDEPEFKNVFGKLKRTETKNYVAPDELKNNILRGKAALNVTGGPKETKRVDEFKESILKQKEAMKAGGGSIRRTGPEKANDNPTPSASPVPEAISKREKLTKSDSNLSSASGNDISSPDKFRPRGSSRDLAEPSRPSNQGGPRGISRTPSPTKTSEPELPSNAATQKDPVSSVGRSLSNESQPPLDHLSGKPERTQLRDQKADETRSRSSTSDAGPARLAPTKEPAPPGKGRLADRLNPALAGILSRGPPASNEAPSKSNKMENTSSTSENREQSSDATLTHMTKARARGPKRRAPKASSANTASSPVKDASNGPKATSPPISSQKPSRSPADVSSSNTPVTSRHPSPEKSYIPSKESNTTGEISTPTRSVDTRVKPTVSTKSPELRKLSPQPPSPEVTRDNLVDTEPKQKLEFLTSSRYIEPTVERSEPNRSDGRSPEREKLADVRPAPPPKSASFSSTTSASSPVVPPKQDQKENHAPQPPPKPYAMDNTGLSPRLQKRINTGLSASSSGSESKPRSPISNKSLPPSPPKKFPSSPSVPPKSPEVARHSIASRIPQTPEAAQTFSDFFNAAPSANDKVNIDPQSVLASKPNTFPKIKTLKKQIWEINGDGKRHDLPPHQDYIFFEESMYLCVHYFESVGGLKTTQVHLWCGDGIGEAALEDAQLFARKVARENSCKLELLKQGKEMANFIQALGGIIITRRGSSSRASSSSQYMLCGRNHLGQIAFDEVDLSPRSLCSKYPYIVAGRSGKVYLWKGAGSGVDEIGCARLIGMDLGEIEEVAEGEEPKSFFASFPDSKDATSGHSLEHWRLKPNHEKYCCRLFRVDHELAQRSIFGSWGRRGPSSPVTNPNDTVQEIMPFSQRDIEPGSIYVLDAFFEIYV